MASGWGAPCGGPGVTSRLMVLCFLVGVWQVGLGRMELAVVVVDWKTPSGKERVGTCTSFLRSLRIDPEHDDAELNTLMVYVQPTGPGGIFHPQDAKVPVMMVGLGTGLAPFRAMVQERKALARAGVELGESALYFGCRT